MSITLDEALQHVDPNITDEDARKQSAQRIVDGIAANEIYWGHRSDLDALRAQAEGHGVVQRGPDNPDETPTAVGSGTATDPNVIEGTATEEPATALGSAASATPGSVTAPSEPAPSPSPDNPNDAIATLRQQLRDANINPEA